MALNYSIFTFRAKSEFNEATEIENTGTDSVFITSLTGPHLIIETISICIYVKKDWLISHFYISSYKLIVSNNE